MKKMKRILAGLLCVGMLASLLTGCGGNAANDGGQQNGEKVEIHYAYWQDTLGPYLEDAKAKFEAQNEGVTIVLEPTAWGEYWSKLENAVTGGGAADVFQMNGPNIGKYVDAGIVLNLDDYIAKSTVDTKNYPEAMNTLYTVEGSQYGVPIDYDTIGLWYNKELFDAAGVAYPDETWTWEDLEAAAEKLTDKEKGVYGIAAGYADQAGFYNTVPASGGYIISEDKTTSGFDKAETIAGIECWVDLIEKGYSPSQASLTENADYVQFMSGKIAMLYAGDWFAATFVTDEAFAEKCDVTYLPTINGNRMSVIHGKANCVNAQSENIDMAWKWVEYLAGAEANEILGKSGAAIPAHLEYSSLFFDQYPQYNMEIFAEEAKTACVYPASKTSAQWGDIIWNELVEAYSLKVSVEDACAKIATEMNKLLETE